MTKLIKSSLVASMALSSLAYAATAAGDLQYLNGSNTITVSKELVAVKDVNVSLGGFIFKPNITDPSSRTNPIFEFKVVNGEGLEQKALDGFKVYELNTTANEYNASAPVSGDPSVNDSTISFAQADSANVKSQSWYVIGKESSCTDSDGNGLCDANATANTPFIYKTIKDHNFTEPNVSIDAKLYTGDTGDLISEANLPSSIEILPEYEVAITKKLDRRTNLCDLEKTFTSGIGCATGDNNDTDTLTFKLAKLGDYTYPFNVGDTSNLVVTFDKNESAIASVTPTTGDTLATAGAITPADENFTVDYNASSIEAATTDGVTSTLNVKVDGNTSINTIAKAAWTFTLVDDDNTTLKTRVYGSDSEGTLGTAGEWKPFGYYAMIPNVTNNSASSVVTNFVITSKAPTEQDIFFTLHADGKTCSLNTIDNASLFTGKLQPDNVMRVDADVLYQACATELGTAEGKTMVEIDIPTEPENIAVHASFSQAGSVFKDLPVYHTGTLSY